MCSLSGHAQPGQSKPIGLLVRYSTSGATYWNLLSLPIGVRPSFHPISHPWHQIAVVTEVNFELHRELKRPRSRRLAHRRHRDIGAAFLAFRGSRMHVTGNYAESLLLPRIVRVR